MMRSDTLPCTNCGDAIEVEYAPTWKPRICAACRVGCKLCGEMLLGAESCLVCESDQVMSAMYEAIPHFARRAA